MSSPHPLLSPCVCVCVVYVCVCICVCMCVCLPACESIAAENVGNQTQAHNEISVLVEINTLLLKATPCDASGRNA